MKKLSILLAIILLTSCSSRKAFKIALLPDTQTYTQNNPEIFEAQTKWVSDNSNRISFVLHQGDITNNDCKTEDQWIVAAKAMSIMDGKVPYALVAGNHDLPGCASNRNTEYLNKYFPYKKYSQLPYFGGAYEDGKIDNTWYTFKAGGINWLVLCLEFGPRNCVLDWANDVIDKHPKHKIIINTHAYMYSDDTRMGAGDDWLPKAYGIGKDTGENTANDGEQMWDKLVRKHSNIMIVVSGHVLHRGAGTLVSKGDHGNEVYQMLANYQGGVNGAGNGKEGYLRILTIDPAKKRIDIKTYSPYINQFKTDSYQQFSFENVNFDLN